MSRSHFRPVALVLLLLGLAATGARAQPAGSSRAAAAPAEGSLAAVFGDSVSVELVEVEVFVTDQGEPVPGLDRDDFRLAVDGRPVEIAHFARVGARVDERSAPDGGSRRDKEPEGAPAAEEPGGAVRPPDPATVVVFLDLLHLGPGSRKRLDEELGPALERAVRPGDEVLVMAYDGGLDVVQPLTSDITAVRDALGRIRPITANQLQGGFADQRALEAVMVQQMVEAKGDTAPGVAGICVRLGPLAETYAEQAHHRVEQSVDALTGFVDSLAGLEGPKVLLHISDGIPLVPGGQVLQYAIELCDGTGAQRGVDYATDVTGLGSVGQRERWDPFGARTRLNELDTTGDWQRLASHANVHRVSFYTIQAGGVEDFLVSVANDVRMSGQTLAYGPRNRQDTLDLVARETGGRALLNANDLSRRVAEALDDFRSHYLLAFQPVPSKPGTVHRIQVEVDRPGAEVRHRKSYRAQAVHERVSAGVLTSLFYGRQANPLGVTVVARPAPGAAAEVPGNGEAEVRRVRLQVHLPLTRLTLLPRGERFEGAFSVFLAARDEDGATTPVRQVSIPVSVPLEGMVRDFVYEVEIPLAPGGHRVAVALRDELGGETSYVHQRVEVPSADGGS